MRRKRPAPVSKKRRAEAATRRAVVEAARERDGGCVGRELVPEVRCAGPFDADEIVSRARLPGGHLMLSNVQILCRAHHDWKHAHPAEAATLGLSGHSWED